MKRQLLAALVVATLGFAATAALADDQQQGSNQRPGLQNPNNDPDVAKGWDRNQQQHQQQQARTADPNNTRKDPDRDTSENDCGHKACGSGPNTVPVDQSTYKNRPQD